MSRRARQLNRDVVETPLWSDNKVVERGVVHGDNAANQLRSLFGYEGRVDARSVGQKYLWGVVVGHRKSVSRECSRLEAGARVVRVEAEMGDGVYFEDRIASVIPRDRGPGVGCEGSMVEFRRRILRACSKACPRRIWLHQ